MPWTSTASATKSSINSSQRDWSKMSPTSTRSKLDTLIDLERFAEKSAQNLIDEIEASKKASLARLIYALGIRMIGERTGQLLAAHFSSLDELADATEEQLLEVGEVGPKVAASIAEFFSEPRTRKSSRSSTSTASNPPPKSASSKARNSPANPSSSPAASPTARAKPPPNSSSNTAAKSPAPSARKPTTSSSAPTPAPNTTKPKNSASPSSLKTNSTSSSTPVAPRLAGGLRSVHQPSQIALRANELASRPALLCELNLIPNHISYANSRS